MSRNHRQQRSSRPTDADYNPPAEPGGSALPGTSRQTRRANRGRGATQPHNSGEREHIDITLSDENSESLQEVNP